MPGRSSTAKDEPDRLGIHLSLLGAMGGTVGSTSQGNLVTDPVMGSPANMHAMASVAEGVHWWDKYSFLVCIFTTRDRQALEPHAWVEDLLRDFFQSTLGINLSFISDSFESDWVPHLLWQPYSGSGHVLGWITLICPPIDGHPSLDWLYDRHGSPPVHCKGSPLWYASGQGVYPREDQTTYCPSEGDSFISSVEISPDHASHVPHGVWHGTPGRPSVCTGTTLGPTDSWAGFPTLPCSLGWQAGNPRSRTIWLCLRWHRWWWWWWRWCHEPAGCQTGHQYRWRDGHLQVLVPVVNGQEAPLKELHLLQRV